MNRLVKVAIVFGLLTGLASVEASDVDLKVSGQVRMRGEGAAKHLDTAYSHLQTFGLLRTRINFKAKVDGNAVAFIQLQDSREIGGRDQFGNQQSATLNDGKNVDVHQAFLKANIWEKDKKSIGFKAGRFEFNWSNQRHFGSVGWHNVGRSWEGGMLWYDQPNFNLTLTGLKLLERNDFMYYRDIDAYGLFANLKNLNTQLFMVFEIDSDTTDLGPDVKAMQRGSLGAFYKRKHNQFDFEGSGVLQFGKLPITGMGAPPFTQEQDITAFMFQFEAGFKIEGDKPGRLALGIDYQSGDDGSDSTKFKTYNNLYYTGHKFNGFMDYFVGGGPNGLVDMYARAKFELIPGWYFMGDVHLFSAAQEYVVDIEEGPGVTLETTKDIGLEFDLTVKTSRIKGITLVWGASFFSAKDNFAIYRDGAYGKRTGVWVYEQAIINF